MPLLRADVRQVRRGATSLRIRQPFLQATSLDVTERGQGRARRPAVVDRWRCNQLQRPLPGERLLHLVLVQHNIDAEVRVGILRQRSRACLRCHDLSLHANSLNLFHVDLLLQDDDARRQETLARLFEMY